MLASGVGGDIDVTERQAGAGACIERGRGVDASADLGKDVAVVGGVRRGDVIIVADGLDAADMAAVGVGRDGEIAFEGHDIDAAHVHAGLGIDLADDRGAGIAIDAVGRSDMRVIAVDVHDADMVAAGVRRHGHVALEGHVARTLDLNSGVRGNNPVDGGENVLARGMSNMRIGAAGENGADMVALSMGRNADIAAERESA